MKDKWKALAAVEASLNKQFNTTSSIVRLGNKVNIPLPSISTGLPTFDYDVVGTGGIPRGRVVEILGAESGGKTTFCLTVTASEQNQGGICAFIDSEHSLDVTYANNLGVDVDNLVVSQPDSGEQALETVEALVDSGAVSLIVVDSVAALVPQAELDGEMGSSHMGLQARLMSQAMRKLRGKCHALNVTILFTNQIREKIGVFYGSNETSPGGRALRFYASLRLDIRKIGGEAGQLKEGTQTIGHKVKIKAIKNKVGIPFKETQFNLIYGKGFDKDTDLIQYAINSGTVEQKGAWCSFDGESYRKDQLIDIKDKLMEAIKKTKEIKI